MKTKMIMMAALAGSLVTGAFAQVNVTITGSTAFRSIAQDRVNSLYDGGVTVTTRDSNTRTYSGTMNSIFTPGTQVTIYMAWSGSGKGMLDVKNGTPVNTINSGVTNTLVPRVPDLAFSDVFPASANPPIANNAFAKVDKVGVVPFVFVKNNSSFLLGVNNITREQAVLLMTAGGLMPPSYLGGVDASGNPLYLAGRDSGSGTRICTEKCIQFKGTPFLFAKPAGAWVVTNGFSSGSFVATTVNANVDAIGYMGLADFATVSNNCTALSYNGVAYNTANVLNGKYSIWGYEHVVTKSGASANQALFRDRLVSAIKDTTYQHTDVNYVGKFEAIADMQVERGADGGSITSLNF
jgi:hypothetical protein